MSKISKTAIDENELLMTGAVLWQTSKPLEVCDEILVGKPKAGQVLVDLKYSGVCHSQLMEARGKRGEDRYLPHLMGHEGTAKVIAVGDGVTKVSAGDWVILGWIKGEGMNVGGGEYHIDNKLINAGPVTTFNTRAVVSENRVFLLPNGLPKDVAVLFGCSALTGAGMLLNEIEPAQKGVLAIIGLGGIGLSALMAAGSHAFDKIIAVDVSEEKLSLSKLLGSTHQINPAKTDVITALHDLTAGDGVDYCIEAAGKTKTIETAFASVRRHGGLCIFASHPEAGATISIDPFELICGKNIRGSWGGSCLPDRDIITLAGQYLEGNLPLDVLISEQYELQEINKALDVLESGKSLRPIIRFDGV